MKKRSKRYKEILKTAVKDKKVTANVILDLLKKTQLQNSMSPLTFL